MNRFEKQKMWEKDHEEKQINEQVEQVNPVKQVKPKRGRKKKE